MYKLIIVDDEAVVRNGLKTTINWKDHGFELIGDYTNGREAWEAVEQHKPDLVISDICMPFMDGLELSSLIMTNYPYIKVIILTGYDEFEYAQQAVRLKVSDFILKPITAQEMRKQLDKAKLEMDEQMQIREDISKLYNQLNQSLPFLKERFLERMVVSGIGQQELEERFRYFFLPLLMPRYLVMVFDIDDFGERSHQTTNYNDLELLRFAGFNIVEEILIRENGILFRTREERMVALISDISEENLLYEKGFRIAEEARHQIEKFLKFTVTVGIGTSCDTSEQLPDSYRNALSALDYRFLFGKNRVLSLSDIEGMPAVTRKRTDDWDRKIASAVKTGSLQDVDLLIEQLVLDLKSYIQIEACYLQIKKVVLTLMNTVQELGVFEENLAAGQRVLFTDIYKIKTLDDIKMHLKEFVGQAITAIAENRNNLTNRQIIRAVSYIEEHYSDEKMSLQDLCRHVLMSTSHFSLVFKQHTGETFIEFLTKTRIEKAKELLLHTTLKFYEIAAKVGYADPNYFSILFKKHTGKTPKEYRDKPGKES
jgi:two-component system response regulator YesN